MLTILARSDVKIFKGLFEFILTGTAGLNKIARLSMPFLEPAIIIQFELLINNKRNYIDSCRYQQQTSPEANHWCRSSGSNEVALSYAQ